MHPPAYGLMRKLGIWQQLAPELSEKTELRRSNSYQQEKILVITKLKGGEAV